MKLAVEEAESEALLTALAGTPCVTSVVGEIETVRACRRAGVPSAHIEALLDAVVTVALDAGVARVAGEAGNPTLRTLDAVHLATALSLREEIDAVVTYDARLADAARDAGLNVLAPT